MLPVTFAFFKDNRYLSILTSVSILSQPYGTDLPSETPFRPFALKKLDVLEINYSCRSLKAVPHFDMAPRKAKPSTPDGNTDSDSDGHVGVPIPKQLPRIVDSLVRF